jgi:hypothetical protein
MRAKRLDRHRIEIDGSTGPLGLRGFDYQHAGRGNDECSVDAQSSSVEIHRCPMQSHHLSSAHPGRRGESPERVDASPAPRFAYSSRSATACTSAWAPALARLEAEVVLEETLKRFPDWHVDEHDVELVRTSTVRGPAHVPIHF